MTHDVAGPSVASAGSPTPPRILTMPTVRQGPEPLFSPGNTGIEKNLLAGLAFHPMEGILRA